jgi:hypothetical protein
MYKWPDNKFHSPDQQYARDHYPFGDMFQVHKRSVGLKITKKQQGKVLCREYFEI